MIDNIFVAFRKRLEHNSWMDAESRHRALRKLENMASVVGHPSWISDANLIAKYYHTAAFETNRYFENAAQAEMLSMVLPLISDADDHQTRSHLETFEGYPWALNAFHISHLVQIQINSAFLQRPLYSSRNPSEMNYGSLGMIVAHEIVHGFDSVGHSFGSQGESHSVLSPSALEKFNSLQECFVDQYSSQSVMFRNGDQISVDGQFTANENIADNGI